MPKVSQNPSRLQPPRYAICKNEFFQLARFEHQNDLLSRLMHPAGWQSHSEYLAVVVSVSYTVTSFTRTRPWLTACNFVFD
jgi:hypothetical protein